MKKTQVLIVGGGFTGLAAANVLSKAGIETIVLERSIHKGGKLNLNGLIDLNNLSKTFNGFSEKSLLLERKIINFKSCILRENTLTSFEFKDKNASYENYFSVFRGPFFNGLAKEVQKNSAKIIYGDVVRSLILENDKVVGVKTDNNKYFSNVVLIAEGTNPLLAISSGLRKGHIPTKKLFLFAEECIELSSKIINKRFHVKDGEGVGIKLFTCFRGIKGIGYLNTNNNSISIGIGIPLLDSIKENINVNDYLLIIKNHKSINELIKDGKILSYYSYTLPVSNKETKNNKIKIQCVNGCIVAGGALMFARPSNFAVFDLATEAICSGKHAADCILHAIKTNDFSKKALSEINSLTESKNSSNYSVYKTSNLNEEEKKLLIDLNIFQKEEEEQKSVTNN